MNIGDKVIGNWGAMFPWNYGVIKEITQDYKAVLDTIVVEWDEEINNTNISEYQINTVTTVADDLFIDKIGIYHLKGDA